MADGPPENGEPAFYALESLRPRTPSPTVLSLSGTHTRHYLPRRVNGTLPERKGFWGPALQTRGIVPNVYWLWIDRNWLSYWLFSVLTGAGFITGRGGALSSPFSFVGYSGKPKGLLLEILQ